MHYTHYFQRKLPEQDIAQGSYIALPLTLLLLLAGYNHDKVGHVFCSIQVYNTNKINFIDFRSSQSKKTPASH